MACKSMNCIKFCSEECKDTCKNCKYFSCKYCKSHCQGNEYELIDNKKISYEYV